MHVLLYTWSSCSFCQRARELLARHGVAFEERPLDGDRALRERLAARFPRPAMPLVLLDGEPLGGLPELEAWLARRGGGDP